jgi:DNA-directed RNA polymerase subunit RPC12/RpoP
MSYVYAGNTLACGTEQGTDRGFQRHLRAREPACDPCKDAHSAYMRDYRRRKGLTTSTLVALDIQCPSCGHHILEGTP